MLGGSCVTGAVVVSSVVAVMSRAATGDSGRLIASMLDGELETKSLVAVKIDG